MKKLNTQTFFQSPKSKDCGPTSVRIVLDYFGIQKTEQELKKGMTYDEVGTFIYDNGAALLKQGLKVQLITANPILFEKEVWSKLKTKKALLEHLTKFQKKKPQKKNGVKIFKDFIKAGGKTIIKVPTFQHLKNAIDTNRLVLASIYGRALGSKEGGYHYVVVSGYKNSSVFINNPLPGSHTGWFPIDDFIYAVHASTCFDIDNGSLLIIEK